ncbi:MAG: HAMP domain-containing protein [Firmicutes bacterium]|nr:HAMP domain-containing protein [Bacillota bacterium]
MINLKSIVSKLWLAMTLLVLMVLLFSVLVQSTLLKRTYYKQQADQLTGTAQVLASEIATETSLSTIKYQIENTANATGVHIMLLDKEGSIVYSREGNRKGWNGRGMMRGQMRHRINEQRVWPEVNMRKVLQGETVSQVGKTPLFDTEVLTVGVPVKREETISGIILMHASLPAITTRLRALQYVAIYTAMGGVVLATILSMFMSRSLVGPLLKINKAARDMASGNYNRKLNINSSDEIGVLAQSFNTLSNELQEKINTLERIDETRRDFVASISHELRTPLTIVQGYTEALQDGLAKDEQQRNEYLNFIQDELARLRHLVNELLDLRRLETGQIKIYSTTFKIQDTAQRLVNGMKPMAEEKGVLLTTNLEDISPVQGDENRLSQVLINLLDNALHVCDKEDIITVSVHENEKRVIVSVSDTGPGIPQEELPLIWDRFHKVDKSRLRDGAGTGLGLAISKQIVELHGGKIEVHSVIGQGTTFSFSIFKANK